MIVTISDNYCSAFAVLTFQFFRSLSLLGLLYDAIRVHTKLFLSLTNLNLKFYASGAVIVILAAARPGAHGQEDDVDPTNRVISHVYRVEQKKWS